MKQWAEVDLPPGQFLGSTGVQTLTPEELGIEDRRFQAWAKKVYFISAMLNVNLSQTEILSVSFHVPTGGFPSYYDMIHFYSFICCHCPVCSVGHLSNLG